MYRLMLLLLMAGAVVPARAEVIEVAGSTTVRAFMEPAADAWHQLHPDVVIAVRGGWLRCRLFIGAGWACPDRHDVA